jgi:hypothetical protein
MICVESKAASIASLLLLLLGSFAPSWVSAAAGAAGWLRTDALYMLEGSKGHWNPAALVAWDAG